MSTGGVTPTSSTASNASIASQLSANNSLNQQQFLKLLITQLSNQDPTSPVDDQQFLAEMAQFSTVQGVTSMDGTMNQLQGADLVGKSIKAIIVANGASEAVNGTVSAVNFKSDGVHLTVNNQDVLLSQVTQVSD